MKIWFSCFFLLFAIAEFYQWAKHLSLPLPIYILGGAFLVIASNSNKHLGLFWHSAAEPSVGSDNSSNQDNLSASSNPAFQQPPKPISFTINRHNEQRQPDETK